MAKFREYITSSGKLVFAGKNAENNEELVNQAEREEILMHTSMPGSPFVNIKAKEAELTRDDIKESAIFCAVKSQDWRDNKKDVTIHIFKGKDIYKEKSMSKGTFGVKNFKEIKIKKQDILKFEDEYN